MHIIFYFYFTDCSCDEDCGYHGNCCYPSHDDIWTNTQECIVPITKQLLPEEKYKYVLYRMVTSCPKYVHGADGTPSDDYIECGNSKIASWGSLFPVYSNKTGYIYKNRKCAECHGVHDYITWKISLSCKSSEYVSAASKLEWIFNDRFEKPDHCELIFDFPFAKSLISSKECRDDVIDRSLCNITTAMMANISPPLNMSAEGIYQACLFGPFAPFQIHKTYANVFCYLCDAGQMFEVNFCAATEAQFGYGAAFTVLIDHPQALSTIDDRKAISHKKAPVACRLTNSVTEVRHLIFLFISAYKENLMFIFYNDNMANPVILIVMC